YRQNNDTYIFLRQDPAFYQNDHINRTLGIEANMAIPLGRGTTGIGIDLNRVTLASNNLGQRERQVASLFAEHNFVLLQDKLSLTPGVQVNYYSDFGFNALPGLDAGYLVANHWRLFGSVGYTYRVPSYTEMYYRDPVNQGNAGLLPEYAMNYEVGGKTVDYEHLQGSVSVFYRQGRNMIDWVRAADTLPWQANNILQVNMAGLELEARYRWRTALGLVALQELQGYYTYINAAFEASETLQSRYALENLRHQFRGTVVLGYGKRLTHTVTAAYYDRVNLPDYTLVDTRLSYRHKRAVLFIDVTNLLDVAYRETNLVSMPGRWFKAGLQVKVL
ncbi:MAG TPA: TonB-dependent receptor, partial [Flammeovirgaceae bacterium]|nr:TonB-dependent receptor [Flammeovirgaceae bacterium]